MRRRLDAPRGARAGFTMVELVVAMAVSGVVALAAYALLGVTADARTRVRHEPHTAQMALGARRALDGWLRAATLADGAEPFAGVSGGASAADEITFAVVDGGTTHPGPHRVQLWVDRAPRSAHGGLVAELLPLGTMGAAPDTLLVAPGSVGLTVRYRADVATSAAVWSREWVSSRVLPGVVELRLTGPAAGASAFSPLLAVPLRVALSWEGR